MTNEEYDHLNDGLGPFGNKGRRPGPAVPKFTKKEKKQWRNGLIITLLLSAGSFYFAIC